MADANELVEALKKAAIKAVEAQKPANVYFGKVVSSKPLKIIMEQKMILGEKQLLLSRHVTDHKVLIGCLTEDKGGEIGESSFSSLSYPVMNRKEITVFNGLADGDEVILMRQQGGQKFIVLDRIGQ